MRSVLFLLALPLTLSCNGDDGDDIAVDSRAVCDCPELSAADIPYENLASGLAGGDVQDAVDELAARPEPASDAYDRVAVVEQTQTSPSAGTDYVLTATCSGGARALGGACEGGIGATSNLSVRRTVLQESAFTCYWNKAEGDALEFTAKVTCLSKAVTD